MSIEMRSDMRTMLVAAIIDDSDPCRNKVRKIPCNTGQAISGCVYDCASDSYVLSCLDYKPIGDIPLYCILRISPNFELKVPLAKEVCQKLMSKEQRKELSDFLASYDCDARVEFLQMVSS